MAIKFPVVVDDSSATTYLMKGQSLIPAFGAEVVLSSVNAKEFKDVSHSMISLLPGLIIAHSGSFSVQLSL